MNRFTATITFGLLLAAIHFIGAGIIIGLGIIVMLGVPALVAHQVRVDNARNAALPKPDALTDEAIEAEKVVRRRLADKDLAS